MIDARRAEGALEGGLRDERLLDRRASRSPVGQPLDGLDGATAHFARASSRQELIGWPSSSTVQAPHMPTPQPSRAPTSAQVAAEHLEQRVVRVAPPAARGH